MATLVEERVELARQGLNPKVVCRVPSGWLVMGDVQVVPAYCLLLPDPVVFSLNDLEDDARLQFLHDMGAVGDALLEVTDAVRINYEILGNTDPALHAHLFPRYADEEPERAGSPVWSYDWEDAPLFDADDDRPLMDALAAAVRRRVQVVRTA